MKKILLLLAFTTLFTTTLLAEDDPGEIPGFSMDVGAGLTFAQFDKEVEPDYRLLEGIFAVVATFRGGGYVNLRYDLSPMLSIGTRAGIYAVTYFPESSKSNTIVDFPLHALVRLRAGFLSLEGFGGYYISNIDPLGSLSGPEMGIRGYIGNVYFGSSMVFSSTNLFRFELGLEGFDIF